MEILTTQFAPRPKELDPIEGVGWGNRASLRMVAGPTYHSIELITNITNPADIERVEVALNGSAKYSISGESLVKLQAHRKNFAESGRYIISFGDPTLRTKVGVRQTDLVTLPGEVWFVYIQLKQKAADANGNLPVAPVMRARAHVLPSQSIRYYMPRLYEMTWFASASGRTPFDFAERSPEYWLKRIHFLSDTIDRVRVLRDNLEELNVTKEDNAFDLAQAKKEQNAGWFSLDFIRYGFGSDGMLNTAAQSQLAFELDKSAIGSVPVVVESVQQVTPLPTKAKS
ncbi:membrane protein [Vibrio nigripulchritudo]|uniref:major capsid protein P2 n=1 Tax=Vibrio nigripulchritudo TaxID=28173 RepID=UPI00190B210B|nr:major capsid protein P2 [Vibrio nigripulchritudo]BCL69691.1 membrane protein [Vibrio nigripulchritudo]BDU31038.1 membrane protein [Vibrio nigripulchritudo]